MFAFERSTDDDLYSKRLASALPVFDSPLRKGSRLALLSILVFMAAVSLPSFRAKAFTDPGTLTPKDREFAIKYMQETRQKLLSEVSGLSQAQLNYKPNAERWSVADIVEHIIVAEETVFGLVNERILKSPAVSDVKAEPRVKDQAILMAITNRKTKFQAPERVQPQGRWKTKAELITNFEKVRGRNISYVQSTSDELRSHFADNPVVGMIDAYQWLLFVTAHGERHTLQIMELKSNPHFPKM